MIEQFLLNGVIAGSIYALIAIGFVVIYRTVRFFHLAHGGVYAVGAYVGYTAIIQWGMHPIIGFFLPQPSPAGSGWRLIVSSTARCANAKQPTSST